MIDLQAIDERINILEDNAISTEDIVELASLYVIKQNTKLPDMNVITAELDDILPQYKTYCNIKRRYQLGEVDQVAVIKALKGVCQEIKEFLCTLYSHTDMGKERILLLNMVEEIHKKFEDK